MKITNAFLVLSLILWAVQLNAQQDKQYPDTTFLWYHSNPHQSEYVGISLKEAYQLAQKHQLKAKEIVVAVIDSGVDTSHADIVKNLWVNPGEIPNNGIDDDKNGYVDDIHGWNFLGSADGYCVEGETLEHTRLYRQLKPKFNGKEKKDIAKEDLQDYKLWLQVKPHYEKEHKRAENSAKNLKSGLAYYDEAEEMLKTHLKKEEITREEVKAIETEDKELIAARDFYLKPFDMDMDRQEIVELISYFEKTLETKLNLKNDPRKAINDKRYDINDSLIGNNILSLESSNHGMGVSGIIAAERGNGIGLDGIAPNVKIMVIRILPGGDEYDKDVALAIRYAVKMGARIINGSFGKDYSPQKELVDEAIRFAAKNDVLFVHASGNDGKNIDKGNNFPTKYLTKPKETAWNWIEVGASGKHVGEKLAAGFSNYGKEVDIFAPGVDIFTTKIKGKYGSSSGTSDAAPVVTGVGALVLSYFPDLTAKELKEILISSGTDYSKQKVKITVKDKEKLVKFRKLSSSGKIVNAEAALRMAIEIKN